MMLWLAILGCGNCPDKTLAEPHTPLLCPNLYDEDKLADFSVEIAPEEWDAILEEYTNWEDRRRQGLELKPYHPLIAFEAEGERIENASIRLKGNPCCSWEGDKMQFVIAFDQQDDDGRFQGLRKLTLDAPPYDPSVMRERIALSYFQDAGFAASCANHARLTINGAYYGLYTNIEYVDREFLERQFPDEDSFGNLFKWDYNARRFDKKNNRPGTIGDLDSYLDVASLSEFEAAYDVEQSLSFWAAEAVINQSDGYWAGSINYYIYNHPDRGWQYFPWDLDNALTFWAARRDPYVRDNAHGIAPIMDWVIEDETWRTRWTEHIAIEHQHHDVDRLIERLDRFAEQIRPSVEAEPHRQFSMAEHDEAVADIRRRLQVRDDYLCTLVNDNLDTFPEAD